MKRHVVCMSLSVLLLAVVTSAWSGDENATDSALLDPSLATATAPDTYDVVLDTTQGEVVIRVHRDWAPNGADRFYNLVRAGYYDGCRFFRVIDGFMAQVGMHGDPKVNAAWRAATIPDDPITQDNTRGRVTFAAQARPNTRTTQIFINTADNTRLKQYGSFAPFGEVVAGMEAVDALYNGYGEGAPQGRGPSQSQIMSQGNAYLERAFPKLDAIVSAHVVTAD